MLLALAGGLTLDLAFPNVGLWFLAFFAIAMLAIAISRNAPGWNFLLGFLFGFAFFLPHLRWAEFAVGGALPWVALSVLEALYIALFAWAWTFVRRVPLVAKSKTVGAVAFGLIWIAVEFLRMSAPFGGFPWGRLGFSQSESPLARLAWLGGVPLISLGVAVIGVLLALAILGLRRLDMFTVGVSGVTAVALVGVGLLIPLGSQAESGTLRVGAVQGNVSNPGLGAFENRQEVLNNHVTGTHQLLDQVEPGWLDLVVWPENGTDIDPQADPDAAKLINDAAREVGAPMLLGAQEFPDSGGRYNVSLLWEADQGVTARYAKQHPAPFGEYMPMRDLLRIFSSAVDLVSTDMIAGTEPAVIEVPFPRENRMVTVAPIICFEVAYDEIISESVRLGAEALMVQTNNASFGYTNESTQQLAMSRLRAIETGRAVVHISTVGVSAVFTPNGAEVARTGHFTPEQMVQTINLRTSLTPAVVLGQWPIRIVSAIAVILLIAGLFAPRPTPKQTKTQPQPQPRKAQAAR